MVLLAGCGRTKKETSKLQGQTSGENTSVVSAGADNAAAGDLEAVFFDVGKGDCILFSSGDSHVLLDTGYQETS
ncbi:MAG TPA: hypothetical protein DCP64_13845, partial [Sarcina sp.]|nr:hypothetical protein [Sarcina sp.]